MALDTYANLQAAIADTLQRTDLTNQIKDFITLCEDALFSDIAAFNPLPRQMETTQTGSVSASTLALPATYMSTKRLRISLGGSWRVLEYKTPEQTAPYTASGLPVYYTTIGENLEIAPPPDSSYSYEWVYYATPTALSNTNTTNWLLTAYPSLYLYGSLAHSAPFLMEDARISVWAALYRENLSNFEEANRRDRISGSTLRIRSLDNPG